MDKDDVLLLHYLLQDEGFLRYSGKSIKIPFFKLIKIFLSADVSAVCKI